MINLADIQPDTKTIVASAPASPQYKLDIACGQAKAEGFTGIDIVQIQKDGKDLVDIVHDLTQYPWPLADASVDEARCSHFFEHLGGFERIPFMNELWRVLKPQAGCLFITPLGRDRQLQDFSHKWPPLVPGSYFYYDKAWLEANGLSHYRSLHGITCDFEVRMQNASLDPTLASRNDEFKMFASRHYTNANIDLTVLMVKRVA